MSIGKPEAEVDERASAPGEALAVDEQAAKKLVRKVDRFIVPMVMSVTPPFLSSTEQCH